MKLAIKLGGDNSSKSGFARAWGSPKNEGRKKLIFFGTFKKGGNDFILAN